MHGAGRKNLGKSRASRGKIHPDIPLKKQEGIGVKLHIQMDILLLGGCLLCGGCSGFTTQTELLLLAPCCFFGILGALELGWAPLEALRLAWLFSLCPC